METGRERDRVRLVSERYSWTHRFGHAYTLEEFMAVRTKLGWSRRRFESVAPEVREAFLRRARLRLEKISRCDFVDDAEIIFATAVARRIPRRQVTRHA